MAKKGKKKQQATKKRSVPRGVSSNGTGTVVIEQIVEVGILGANQTWGPKSIDFVQSALPHLAEIEHRWSIARITRVTGQFTNALAGTPGTVLIILESFQRQLTTEALYMGAGAKVHSMSKAVMPITTPPATSEMHVVTGNTNYGWRLHIGVNSNAPIDKGRNMGIARLVITFFCQGPK